MPKSKLRTLPKNGIIPTTIDTTNGAETVEDHFSLANENHDRHDRATDSSAVKQHAATRAEKDSDDAQPEVLSNSHQMGAEVGGNDEEASDEEPGAPDTKVKNDVKDPKPTTKATLCSKKSEDQLKGLQKSQLGEDVKLLEYFNGLCSGSYIEMGTLDGLMYSNSHVFNKALGWKGLLVKLNPINYKELVKNRRDEIAVVHAAVCANHQTVHYVAGDEINRAVGGIWEFAAPSFRKNWWKDVTVDTLPAIECSPLQDIISKQVAKEAYFDFFSLDIEGAESMALKSIDFTKVSFGIILVEADSRNQRKNLALRTFLVNRGYIFLEKASGSYWFYNSRFDEIYSDLL